MTSYPGGVAINTMVLDNPKRGTYGMSRCIAHPLGRVSYADFLTTGRVYTPSDTSLEISGHPPQAATAVIRAALDSEETGSAFQPRGGVINPGGVL